jgi:hypothetical protein
MRSTYIPDPATGYGLAEKAVKTVIVSYIRCFVKENLFQMSKKLGVSIFGIPDNYLAHARSAEIFYNLPAKCIKKESLYYIPNTETPLEFKRIPEEQAIRLTKIRSEVLENIDNATTELFENMDEEPIVEKWSVFLKTINVENGESPAPESSLDRFGNEKKEIVRLIQGAYNGAIGVFCGYKASNPVFETWDLKYDKDNFCLRLEDSRFPGYILPIQISFSVERLS